MNGFVYVTPLTQSFTNPHPSFADVKRGKVLGHLTVSLRLVAYAGPLGTLFLQMNEINYTSLNICLFKLCVSNFVLFICVWYLHVNYK